MEIAKAPCLGYGIDIFTAIVVILALFHSLLGLAIALTFCYLLQLTLSVWGFSRIDKILDRPSVWFLDQTGKHLSSVRKNGLSFLWEFWFICSNWG